MARPDGNFRKFGSYVRTKFQKISQKCSDCSRHGPLKSKFVWIVHRAFEQKNPNLFGRAHQARKQPIFMAIRPQKWFALPPNDNQTANCILFVLLALPNFPRTFLRVPTIAFTITLFFVENSRSNACAKLFACFQVVVGTSYVFSKFWLVLSRGFGSPLCNLVAHALYTQMDCLNPLNWK